MAIEFFMAMKKPPTVTHQEKQVRVVNGKPVFYEPVELKVARTVLRAHLSKHAPKEPMQGAVRLSTMWCFPRGTHADGSYRITKPDTDNLQKLLKDVMTDLGFWKDDAQVASELAEKFWAEIPGIYIRAEEITDE
ncbi:MAG: RusA family crossover junction endodeoxyribonuclease [Eubacteriales bacterium]|nr:RusA family crossover junction endodeoxyribonuclease [Eubacteriales bacterium]